MQPWVIRSVPDMETGLRKGSAVGEAALDCGEISKGGGIENCGGWEVKEQ